MSQRFSEAELAAEMWYAMYRYRIACATSSAIGSTRNLERREHEAGTLIRFAERPHAHPEAHYCDCGHLDVHHYLQDGHCLDNESPVRACRCKAFK